MPRGDRGVRGNGRGVWGWRVGEREGVQEEGACGEVRRGGGVGALWKVWRGARGGEMGGLMWNGGVPGKEGALGEEGICSLVPLQLKLFGTWIRSHQPLSPFMGLG